MTHTIKEKVKRTICEYSMLPEGTSVLAAVSGGADSVSLLRLLCILKDECHFTLSAAHINHGLRGEEADRDEQFVRNLCENWNVPLFVLKADVKEEAARTGESVEECGRRIRYDFFEKNAGDGKIATAHTLSDSCETLILNLARGSGLKGLCGIPPVRGNIVRPLIECSRTEIEEFCRCDGLSFVTDSTNAEDHYRRNFVRHTIIPRLYDLNPSFEAAVLRLTAQNRRDEAFLEAETACAVASAQIRDGQYSAASISNLPDSLKFRTVAAICAGQPSPESRHIKAVCESLERKRAKVNLPGDRAAVISGGKFQITPAGPKLHRQSFYFEENVSLSEKEAKIKLPFATVLLKVCDISETNGCEKINNLLSYTLLDRDKIGKNLIVRGRLPKDRIKIPARGCTKTLKKLWNEQKIPPAERFEKIVLSDEKGIIFAEGAGADARCAITHETRHTVQIEILREDKNE